MRRATAGFDFFHNGISGTGARRGDCRVHAGATGADDQDICGDMSHGEIF